ncbi:transporter, partial [Salmonella enterica subsp. enterica serovar Kentucky]|nr:transporter [Salmonella enterica subsp. enterica serovar Kentucky]
MSVTDVVVPATATATVLLFSA